MLNVRQLFITSILSVAMVFGFAAFASEAEAAGELAKIRKEGRIRIAVYDDGAPFSYKDENGEAQGYDVYLARRIAKDLLGDESKVDFVFVGTQNRINVLQANQVDLVLANFTVTPRRAEYVDFAKPYMKVSLGVMSPQGAVITDVKQLKGKKLLVEKGSTADSYFKKNHPEVVLIEKIKREDAYEAFRNGESDAFSHDNGFILAWMLENPGFKMGIEVLGDVDTIAPAVRKGNTELLEWVNEEITTLHEEGFFIEAYNATFKPVFKDLVAPKSILIEKGQLP